MLLNDIPSTFQQLLRHLHINYESIKAFPTIKHKTCPLRRLSFPLEHIVAQSCPVQTHVCSCPRLQCDLSTGTLKHYSVAHASLSLAGPRLTLVKGTRAQHQAADIRTELVRMKGNTDGTTLCIRIRLLVRRASWIWR